MSKATDTCLRAVFKSCFGAFQCANNLVSGKIEKTSNFDCFRGIKHGFSRNIGWSHKHNRSNYPFLGGSPEFTHVAPSHYYYFSS